MGYTQTELDMVERRAKADAASSVPVKDFLDGEALVSRRIPKKMYWNAVQNGYAAPEDEEYWRDMERVCPYIVPERSGKVFLGGRGCGGKPRNRFGNIKTRTIYRGKQKIQVI